MRKPMPVLLILALALLALAATGKPQLTVKNAWVRPTPPGAPAAAMFLLVENHGAADRLLRAESDAADAVELHTMQMKDGMMMMRPVPEGFAVPAGGALQLKPGGDHIMLIGPKAPIAASDTVTVTLVFAKAGRMTVQVPAAHRAGAMGGAAMGTGPGKPAMPGMGNGKSQVHPAQPKQ